MSTVKAYTPPKNLATCVDDLYTTRQQRLDLEKKAKKLSEREALLREHIINNLPKSNASGIAGKVASGKIEMKEVVQVDDWDAFREDLIKRVKKDPGAWSLMQKRIGDTAIKEIFDAGKTVAGCKIIKVPFVSLSKV